MDVLKSDTFEAWLQGLRDEAAKAKVTARLLRLSIGNAGDAAPVGSGVSELRIHVGPGYRVYYTRHGDLWVALCGGDKSTQAKDIQLAIRLAAGL